MSSGPRGQVITETSGTLEARSSQVPALRHCHSLLDHPWLMDNNINTQRVTGACLRGPPRNWKAQDSAWAG